MGSIARLLAPCVGVLMLAWCSYVSICFGVAGSAEANAAGELERISRSTRDSAGGWWRDDLRRALVNVPKDPTAHELLAVGLLASNKNSEDLLGARDHLIKAISQRPGSGYTWASLAAVKYRLGETDAMFESALMNAINLAPFELEVQRDVVNYGLAVIDEVKPETGAAVERAVAVGMKRNPPEILQISARRGKLGTACRHLDGVPRPAASKWTQLCQSMEAPS